MAAAMKKRAAATAQAVLIESKLTTTFHLVNLNWGGRVHFPVSNVFFFIFQKQKKM